MKIITNNKTRVYANYEEFSKRRNKKENGIDRSHSKLLKNVTLSGTNTGCWNCVSCENCTDCSDCVGCHNCNNCINCVGCFCCIQSNRLSQCVKVSFSRDCSYCSSCTKCTGCRDISQGSTYTCIQGISNMVCCPRIDRKGVQWVQMGDHLYERSEWAKLLSCGRNRERPILSSWVDMDFFKLKIAFLWLDETAKKLKQ